MDRRHSEIIYSGAMYQICAVVENGRCPVKDFIDSLKESAQKSIMVLLKRAGDYGPPRNEEKFKKLTDQDLFEFKDFQTRILCHYDKGGKIILAHALSKQKDKLRKSDIKRAYDLLSTYRKERR